MRLLNSFRRPERSVVSLEDYAAALNSFQYGGSLYGLGGPNVQETLKGSPVENIPNSFAGYANAYRANGVVFACMLARMQVFSATRFQFQGFNGGRPGKLFGTPALEILEEPWVGGTTQDLLVRMIQDADLAGNSYTTRGPGGAAVRLRPDWVTIVLAVREGPDGPLGYRRVGYVFEHDGPAGDRLTWVDPENMAHFAPIPDPMATYRGMSWLTPVVREAQTDGQFNDHKQKFLANAATPNMAISLDASIEPAKFVRFMEEFKKEHAGAHNAGKTLFLGGGATPSVIGSDFRKMELKATQGHGETRIAAAAGVPPIIVGLSEGLEAATYSNYGQARRRFADGTIHPLWQNAAGSLARICKPPTGSRLWYDSRDVPFLREDEKDAAEIKFVEAQTIRQLIESGYEPDAVIDALTSGDYGHLLNQHTGNVSVQLQPPGTASATPSAGAAPSNSQSGGA